MCDEKHHLEEGLGFDAQPYDLWHDVQALVGRVDELAAVLEFEVQL